MNWFKSGRAEEQRYDSVERDGLPDQFAQSGGTTPIGVTARGHRKKVGAVPAGNRSGVTSMSVADRKRSGPVLHIDVATHVRALVELLREADYPAGYQLNFQELRKIYREMCVQNRWRERGWISIGRAFDLLTTNGRKPYANFWNEEGRAQRLRVYPIPPKVTADSYAEGSRAAA